MLTCVERAWQNYVKNWLVWCRFLCKEGWLSWGSLVRNIWERDKKWKRTWRERQSVNGLCSGNSKIYVPCGENCTCFTTCFFQLFSSLQIIWVFLKFGRKYPESDFEATLFFLDAFLQRGSCRKKKQLQNIIAFLFLGNCTCFFC